MGTVKVTNIEPIADNGTVTLGGSGDTITVPTGVTTTLTDGVSGDFKMNSGFGSVATAYGVRAWVNFDGTGTPSIRASGNVSSITDNGTGDYTVNFTTTMPDNDYAVTATSGKVSVSQSTALGDEGSGSCRIFTFRNNVNTAIDADLCCVAIFR